MKKIPFSTCLILFIVSVLYLSDNFAEDYTQWHLPEGAKTRLGKGKINEIQLSPDGTQLAVATSIGVWLHNAHSGEELDLLNPMTDISSISFSPDGQTLATGGRDSTIYLWNVATGKQIKTLIGHKAPIISVSFSPDGQTLATGGRDSTIYLWNVATGKKIKTLRCPGILFSLAFSPDGTVLVSIQNDGGPGIEPAGQAPSPFPGDQGNFISLWDVATGREFATPFVSGGVYSLAFSPDSAMIASGSGKEIHLWETATGEHIKTLTGHISEVYSLAFSPNGLTLASGSWDKTICLWDITTEEHIKTLIGHTSGIKSLAFSPNGLTLASGGWDKTIHLWDATTGAPLRNLEGHTERIERLVFSPDGATLISQSSDQTIRLWGTAIGKPIKVLTGYMEDLQSLAFSPDGTVLATGEDYSFDKKYAIYLWDTTTGNLIKTLTGYRAAARSLAFSPDGTILANGNYSYRINLWNVATGEHIKTLTKYTEKVPDYYGFVNLAFSPDGTILISGSYRGIDLWNVASGERLKNFNGLGGGLYNNFNGLDGVNSLAFSPDGTIFASGGYGKIDLWDVVSGEHIGMLKEHKGWIQSLAFSSDGTKLVSGNRKDIDHTYEDVITGSLWNLATSENLQTLTTTHKTRRDNRCSVSFASDEPVLASTDFESGIVLLWDFNAAPSVLEEIPEDVNGDGVLNIQDLVWVAENLGQMGPNTADVNGDGIVDIRDLVKVASAIVATAAAPSMYSQALATLTAADVQRWLAQAQQLNLTDAISQRGIRFLEQLLDALIPKKTALLPNYPNPFNPETWIPYQLAEPAEVTVTIYAVDGTVVRTLELGHQPIGIYHDRHRAVYWDGKNELGEPAASSVYFYTLTVKEFKATRKMIMQK